MVSHIRVEATGKTVNRCVRLGLEIYVNYSFCGDGRVILWVTNSLEKLGNELHVKVKNNSNKNIFVKHIKSWGVRCQEANLAQNIHAVLEKVSALAKCLL